MKDDLLIINNHAIINCINTGTFPKKVVVFENNINILTKNGIIKKHYANTHRVLYDNEIYYGIVYPDPDNYLDGDVYHTIYIIKILNDSFILEHQLSPLHPSFHFQIESIQYL